MAPPDTKPLLVPSQVGWLLNVSDLAAESVKPGRKPEKGRAKRSFEK